MLPLKPNAMANVIAGKKNLVVNGLTNSEVQRLVKSQNLNLVDGDKILVFKETGLIETPLYADAHLNKRAVNKDGEPIRYLTTSLIVLHKDDSYDAAEVNLSFLSGKDVYTQSKVYVRKGASGNLYYAYHELDAVNSTSFQLPLVQGAIEFSYDFCLEVKGTVDGFKELPLSFSFVEDETGRFTNCKTILDKGEGGEMELKPTSRPYLVKATMPNGIAGYKRAVLKFRDLILSGYGK
jgi:hypothetical protein